jgi:hypothetical protein
VNSSQKLPGVNIAQWQWFVGLLSIRAISTTQSFIPTSTAMRMIAAKAQSNNLS